jgi:hypothetical protein
MKWLPVFLVLGLIAAVIVLQRNTVRVTYVNGLETYNHLPGTEYIFQKDCYIFKLTERDTSWPLVGANDTVPELPATVERSAIGADLPGVRILETVRVGDRFRIVSVRRDESRDGTLLTFEILFLDEEHRAYPRLDAYYMMDHRPEDRGEAPFLLSAYAAPVFGAGPR